MKYKINDRVIIKNLERVSSGRDSFIGQIGTIIDINERYSFPYYIKFDNTELESKNEYEGYLWCNINLQFANLHKRIK